MNALPASVEASLAEAGFTPTEILILRRLMEDDALSLRELAAKTGKSTGVLDQALKKLLRRNILRKDSINESAKYTIASLDGVKRAIEDDIAEKKEALLRRHQNFESFVQTLEHDKKRPDIEYFDGLSGVAQVYRRLLNCGSSEILQFVPVHSTAQEDPLRDFRVEHFRERRRRAIFSRTIAHDTPLGRRYQSRDPFEYRLSLLVPQDQYPFDFEKVVVGDCLACINIGERRACLLHYPELALMERQLFEGIWKQHTKTVAAPPPPAANGASVVVPIPAASVPLQTRALSGLREFFLSRQSITVFAILSVVAASLTFSLHLYTRSLEFQRMREAVKAIAVTGAFTFDAADLDQLRTEADWKKPQWEKVVKQLEQIRKHNEDVLYVYLMRKTDKTATKWEFVADSHSVNPYANVDNDPSNDVDANNDGKIEAEGPDKLQWPGQGYEGTDFAFEEPQANTDFEDFWGRVITASAPITDTRGQIVANLGIDMSTRTLDKRMNSIVKPILYFFVLLIVFIFIRLAAFNRSLGSAILSRYYSRKNVSKILSFLILSTLGIFFLYQYLLNQTINEVGNKIISILTTVSVDFEVSYLEKLRNKNDMKTPEYQLLFNKLNNIRSVNAEMKYIYVMRGTEEKDTFEFIVDADSNYNLADIGPDFNHDGILNDSDENVFPGFRTHQVGNKMLSALEKATFEPKFYTDQWGTWISGYAPIKKNGEPYAFIGADVDYEKIKAVVFNRLISWIWFYSIGISLFVLLGKIKKRWEMKFT